MTTHRILVVEDNERNLKLVRDVLQYAGYEIIEARTGEQGVELARECCAASGADGSAASGHRRRAGDAAASGRRPDEPIPVVALTASAMKDDRDRVLRAGFDGYLEKPISVRDLPGQVLAFVTGRETSR